MKKCWFFMVLSLLFFITNSITTFSADSDTLWTKSFYPGSGYVSNALFSPDDKSIYVTTTEKFFELETETGKIIREIPEIRGAKYFSKDGRYAYTYDLKKVDMLTKETKGSFVNSLLPWYYYDFDMCESAKMYVGIIKHGIKYPVPDSTIGIFDTETFELKKIIQLPNNYMEKVTISPDGRFIATNSLYYYNLPNSDESVYITTILDGKTYKKISQLETGGSTLLKFSPDGKYLGVGGGIYIYLYDTETWKLVDTFNFDPPTNISSFTFSNDSKYIYFTRPGKNITIKDILTNTLVKELNPKRGGFFQLNISFQNQYLVAMDDATLFLFQNKLTDVSNYKMSKITIIPNPIKHTMIINGLEQPVKNISIYDLKGNIVYTKSDFQINSTTLKINLNFLVHGTYLLKVKTLSNEFSSKFVKE